MKKILLVFMLFLTPITVFAMMSDRDAAAGDSAEATASAPAAQSDCSMTKQADAEPESKRLLEQVTKQFFQMTYPLIKEAQESEAFKKAWGDFAAFHMAFMSRVQGFVEQPSDEFWDSDEMVQLKKDILARETVLSIQDFSDCCEVDLSDCSDVHLGMRNARAKLTYRVPGTLKKLCFPIEVTSCGYMDRLITCLVTFPEQTEVLTLDIAESMRPVHEKVLGQLKDKLDKAVNAEYPFILRKLKTEWEMMLRSGDSSDYTHVPHLHGNSSFLNYVHTMKALFMSDPVILKMVAESLPEAKPLCVEVPENGRKRRDELILEACGVFLAGFAIYLFGPG